MVRVELSRRAVGDLDALPRRVARRIVDALDELARGPTSRSLDVKPLVGRRPWRRLRVGDYRVLFCLSRGGKILLVARVVNRKDLERAVLTLPD